MPAEMVFLRYFPPLKSISDDDVSLEVVFGRHKSLEKAKGVRSIVEKRDDLHREETHRKK